MKENRVKLGEVKFYQEKPGNVEQVQVKAGQVKSDQNKLGQVKTGACSKFVWFMFTPLSFTDRD